MNSDDEKRKSNHGKVVKYPSKVTMTTKYIKWFQERKTEQSLHPHYTQPAPTIGVREKLK